MTACASSNWRERCVLAHSAFSSRVEVRHARRTYGVSPSTIFQAYYLLEDRGLIQARARSGYFVRAQRPVVISADKSVKYETVVKAMNQLKASGIERVGLSVQTTGAK